MLTQGTLLLTQSSPSRTHSMPRPLLSCQESLPDHQPMWHRQFQGGVDHQGPCFVYHSLPLIKEEREKT